MEFKDLKTENFDEKDKFGIGLIVELEKWLKEHQIKPSLIRSEKIDGEKVFYLDVDGDVWFDYFNLEDVATIPNYIKFRNVTGKFILGNKK